jgi:hypothetical protein
MPTLLKCIQEVCAELEIEIPPLSKRADLGSIIIQKYCEQKPENETIPKVWQEENGQKFKVIDYPKKFKPIILEILRKELKPKPLRRRTPIRTPIFQSTKNS